MEFKHFIEKLTFDKYPRNNYSIRRNSLFMGNIVYRPWPQGPMHMPLLLSGKSETGDTSKRTTNIQNSPFTLATWESPHTIDYTFVS